MRPFNLEEYLANPSRKIVTRDGRKVRIICTDAKGVFPIIALVERCDATFGTVEEPITYTKGGDYYSGKEHIFDLFFAPEKHEGWVKNMWGSYLFVYLVSINGYIIVNDRENKFTDAFDRLTFVDGTPFGIKEE